MSSQNTTQHPPNNTDTSTNTAITTSQKSVILFYKYSPLSDDITLMEPYRKAMERLCSKLNLSGRVLIGLSNNAEGINGTLSGAYENVYAYTTAMVGTKNLETTNDKMIIPNEMVSILEEFQKATLLLSQNANIPLVTIPQSDFKWSLSDNDPFPDLKIRLVKEIINTGGKLSSISIDQTSTDYLTPEEWHSELKSRNNTDAIVIDCRNHKEYEIGHFAGAMDPNTKTFEQFPHWVSAHRNEMDGKDVLMYCTGGIRCEKASAFVRIHTGARRVRHLRGGIHKYLEKYGSEGLFKGKNFVFDKRGVDDFCKEGEIVGKCLYCGNDWDVFTPDGVCTVCREPTLVCPECRGGVYHCADHFHLRKCYFTDLSGFSIEELSEQQATLEKFMEDIAVGKKYKQKRRTLWKQWQRIQQRIKQLREDDLKEANDTQFSSPSCRNCGEKECNGECWGFHGLGRKQKLEQTSSAKTAHNTITTEQSHPIRKKRQTASQRTTKLLQKQYDISEIKRLQLSLPPNAHRDPKTSLRCPPPCIRILQSSTKGKWHDKTLISVLTNEFAVLSDENLREMTNNSLIRINDIAVTKTNTLLKNMDVISRVLHWHEPPVLVPPRIRIQKLSIPKQHIVRQDDTVIYACDKPSTVPVHPAGPYLSNTLTLMVEGQEHLEPRSLLPCHRLDRVTSGLTLCCTSKEVARLVQSRMDKGMVEKLYLARVKGKFPSTQSECQNLLPPNTATFAKWEFYTSYLQVDAPIETTDPIQGLRSISPNGKSSQSRFQMLHYDETRDLSLVACSPLTGRGHQLRVHLQWIDHPVHNDVQYGGDAKEEEDRIDDVITSMVSAIQSESMVNVNSAIDQEVARAARRVCQCCRGGPDGIKSCFNSAQLLRRGHAIDLHAWKYKIRFDGTNEEDFVTEMVFSTETKPVWAKGWNEAKDVPWIVTRV